MLESIYFTITILICASVRVTEEGLVMRPTRAFLDVLNMGRREHLMTKSYVPGVPGIPGKPGQVPGSLQQRRPLVGRQKIGIGQHFPRLPRGYTPSRYRPQQRPHQPRNIFRQNNPDLTTSTTGPILRQKPNITTPNITNPNDTNPKDTNPNDTNPNDTNPNETVIASPNNTDTQNQQTFATELVSYSPIPYEGPSTRSTSPLYAPGQEPQHSYTDKALQEKCKNAQCNPVAWQDVQDIT